MLILQFTLMFTVSCHISFQHLPFVSSLKPTLRLLENYSSNTQYESRLENNMAQADVTKIIIRNQGEIPMMMMVKKKL